MGFWNSNKDIEKKTKEQAQQIDRAAANQKAPSVLAGSDPVKPGSVVSSALESKDGERAASCKSPCMNVRTEEGLIERYGVIRSALGKGTVIQGKLSFDTPVRIDGSLTGDVYSSQVLIVGETGNIEADIEVDALIVMGKVRGKIKARKRVELWSGGLLEGEITTPALVIEENSKFNAQCCMQSATSSLNSEKLAPRERPVDNKAPSAKSPGTTEAPKEVRLH